MTAHPLPDRFNAAAFFVDRHLAEGRGARSVFRSAGRAVSYGELADMVNRCGNGLASLGVEMENRVLLALDDSPAFAAVFWGAVKIGAVAVPVNTLMSTADYEFLLNDSRASVAVVEDAVAEKLASLRARCPFVRSVVPASRFRAWLAACPATLEPAPTSPEDIMFWGYTSGSTGAPKAAVHSHKDFVAAADLVGVGVFGLDETDVTFSASKMFFSFGLGNSLYFPARVGAAAVLVPDRMDPERALTVIDRERPSVFFAVATLYARMLQVPDAARRYDLSSLRLCVSSGESLPAPIFDAWGERFGHELVDVVGSTEALHDFIANRPGKARRGSAGQIVSGFDAKLVDDDGQPVAANAVGHLLIKGPTTAPHYWNRLERTRATMLGEWLRTGDMFSRDEEGYFYFAGRSDDMLKVGGQWVSPAEVESRLLEHPAVLEAGVIGRLDAAGLTRPAAFVVLKPEARRSADLIDELTTFVRGGLAGFKTPRWIEIVDELPKTATGKIQRFRLRARS